MGEGFFFQICINETLCVCAGPCRRGILDRNKLLINEINHNHDGRYPEGLQRNVVLITELNNNINKVRARKNVKQLRPTKRTGQGWLTDTVLVAERGGRRRTLFFFTELFLFCIKRFLFSFVPCWMIEDRRGRLEVKGALTHDLTHPLLSSPPFPSSLCRRQHTHVPGEDALRGNFGILRADDGDDDRDDGSYGIGGTVAGGAGGVEVRGMSVLTRRR